MRRLTVILATAAATAALIAGSIAVLFTFHRTKDGIMLLHAEQAKECIEGGGCGIFSQRELQATVYAALSRMHPPAAVKPEKRKDM